MTYKFHSVFALIAPIVLTMQAQTVTTTIPVANPSLVAVNPVTNKIYVAGVNGVTVIDGASNAATTFAVGSHLDGIAVNPVTNKIYVTGNGLATVIDGATNTATSIAGVATGPIAVNPVTNKIYAATIGRLTVIDGATNTATTIFPVGSPALGLGIAVNPVTNKVYMTSGTGITILDGATNTTTFVSAGAGVALSVIAVNPVTNNAYAAAPGSNLITILDGATNSVTSVSTGTQPEALAVNPVTNKIYVGNSLSNSVTVIDGATRSTSTVPVGNFPAVLAVNALTNQIYVANIEDKNKNVTVIDGATNSTITLNTGYYPTALGINPVTNKIYLANGDTSGAGDTVTVIDGAVNSATLTSLTSGRAGVNPVTNKIYLGNGSNPPSVTVIDGTTNGVIATIPGTGGPLAVNPLTNKIYVANVNSNNVTVIDGAIDSPITNIPTGLFVNAPVINPVTNKIYVANTFSFTSPNRTTVIDGATDSVITNIDGVGGDLDEAVNPVTNKIYTIGNSGNLVVIDGATNSTTTLGFTPTVVAANPITNKIYALSLSSNNVTVIDGNTNAIIATVPTPSANSSLTVNSVTNKIYATNFYSNSVTVIDGITNSAATVAVGNQPVPVTVNTATNKIYVFNSGDNTVTMIDGSTYATSTINGIGSGTFLAVNPVTGKVYVTGPDVSIITEQNVQSIPIQTTIAPLANNQTTSLTPGFSFTATNIFTTAPVDNLLYQVDTWQGPWLSATNQGNGGFSGVVGPLLPGFHILYAYSTDGQEGPSTNTGTQSSPLVGNIAAYGFLALAQPSQIPPTVSLTGAPASAVYQSTFTVTATTNASTAATITASGVCTISGNLVTMISGTGICTVTANWPADQTYRAASATLFVTAVKETPTLFAANASAVFSPNAQNVIVGVGDSDSTGHFLSVGTVTFTILSGGIPIGSPVTVGPAPGYFAATYTLPPNTPVGIYVIQAAYSGTQNFAAAVSDANLIVTAAAGALIFVPVTPCRVADTRNPDGPFGGPELDGSTSRDFEIPNSSCGIPDGAAAYSLNVTVVPDAQLNYLTIWPSDQSQPLVSTLNSDGRIKANAAIVPASTSGAVSVFVTDPTQVILDIDGYFVAAEGSPGSALAFYPLVPCRIADTRQGGAPFGAPSLLSGETRSFPLLESPCNIPSGAQAYSLNITAIPHNSLGYLTTWPTGQNQPLVSTLNASTGAVTANAAVVPAGTNGDISIYVTDATDLIIDIDGYFGPPAANALWLYPVAPCRVLDTRSSSGQFNGTLPVNLTASACAPSSTAQAFVLNATVVPPGPLTYLTLWPNGQPQPYVSTLNSFDGAITSNMAIVPTTNGSIDAFASNPTQLILDISGFFAP